MANNNGRPLVTIDAQCQYKGLVFYTAVVCNVSGHFSLSKDGKVFWEGPFSIQTDPDHGRDRTVRLGYACHGPGSYTLKVTNISTVESELHPRGRGPVPDITVTDTGC
ncbi:hypothetical protein AB0K09_19470 [Streptomyces sp. NPDC049577]|uniref:hypothetical protein n=1 Tax=Streptomyces sp. NPDC049577 TaxID=3155153 RepID=UPI003417AABF